MNATPLNRNTPQASLRTTSRVRRCATAIALLISLSLAGCASTSPTYHKILMQGQVLSVDGSSIVVCLGEQDGAQVGQELPVVRHIHRPAASKAPGSGFQRKLVGTARIDTVFDAHYARAQVLTGDPQVNDMVELERK